MPATDCVVSRSLVRLFIALCLITGTPRLSQAVVQVTFKWTPSPAWNELGDPLPAAVAYGVWLAVDHGADIRIATVSDTSYTLSAVPGRIYNLRVCGIDAEGQESPMSQPSDDYSPPAATAVAPPRRLGLASVFPNPFNPRTTITYHVPVDLPRGAPLSLAIYDQRGRLVRRFDPEWSTGRHTASWDGRDNQGASVPTGLYIARYVCGASTASLKMTMVR